MRFVEKFDASLDRIAAVGARQVRHSSVGTVYRGRDVQALNFGTADSSMPAKNHRCRSRSTFGAERKGTVCVSGRGRTSGIPTRRRIVRKTGAMLLSIAAERSFLWWRTAEWEAVGVWLTGIVTIGLLIYAVMQLHEARGVRDDQTRPYIVVDFHFKSVMVALSVKNIGQTPAKNVRVRLDKPVTSAVMPSVEWQESGLFKDGVSMFAPGAADRGSSPLSITQVPQVLG